VTPKFHVGDVVYLPDSNQDWIEEPPGTRYKVVAVEDRVELIPELKRQNDPHRYDKLHLRTLTGEHPKLMYGSTVFALWCRLDEFMSAANHAIEEDQRRPQ